MQALAAAHVNDAGVGRGYGDGSHRAGRLAVEDGIPGPSVIRRLPNPAIDGGDVKQVGLAGNAGYRHRPPAAKRADHPPLHFGVKAGVELLGEEGLASKEKQSQAERRCEPANALSRTNHEVLHEGGIYIREGFECKPRSSKLENRNWKPTSCSWSVVHCPWSVVAFCILAPEMPRASGSPQREATRYPRKNVLLSCAEVLLG